MRVKHFPQLMTGTKHKHRQYNYTFVRSKQRRQFSWLLCYEVQEQGIVTEPKKYLYIMYQITVGCLGCILKLSVSKKTRALLNIWATDISKYCTGGSSKGNKQGQHAQCGNQKSMLTCYSNQFH